MSTTATYSKVLVKEWHDYEQVGIWDNCKWTVRLYEDRAIYKGNTVRWSNNSGSLAEIHERWTGKVIETLKRVAREEIEDDADYTDKVYEIIRESY
jgi:hypothetical protein